MKKSSTMFLKAIILFMGTGVLTLCVFVLPNGIRATHWDGYRPILLGMYISAIPFFFALYQAFKLLQSIDQNNAFSKASIKALQYIKYCGIIIGALYGVGLPYIVTTAQKDDAPGVLVIGLVFTFGSFAVAVLASVLQKVFQNAIKIKSQNDLTI